MDKDVKKLQGHSPSQLSMHKFVLVSIDPGLPGETFSRKHQTDGKP